MLLSLFAKAQQSGSIAIDWIENTNYPFSDFKVSIPQFQSDSYNFNLEKKNKLAREYLDQQILDKTLNNKHRKDDDLDYFKSIVNIMIHEGINQALELAAEKVEIIEVYNAKENGFNAAWEKVVNKQSILDINKQVKV